MMCEFIKVRQVVLLENEVNCFSCVEFSICVCIHQAGQLHWLVTSFAATTHVVIVYVKSNALFAMESFL